MIGNKIVNEITNVSKKKSTKELPNDETEEDTEISIHKKRYISPEERQKIIDELRLVPKKDAYFKKLLIHISLEEKKEIMNKLKLVQ